MTIYKSFNLFSYSKFLHKKIGIRQFEGPQKITCSNIPKISKTRKSIKTASKYWEMGRMSDCRVGDLLWGALKGILGVTKVILELNRNNDCTTFPTFYIPQIAHFKMTNFLLCELVSFISMFKKYNCIEIRWNLSVN